jgi:hypothetical protein
MKAPKKSLKKPSRSPSAVKEEPARASWVVRVKDSFTAMTAVVSFVAAVLGLLVIYANNKGAFSTLTNDFYAWLYDSEEWTGLFNNFPEGYVDMASMELSDTPLQLVLTIERGRIDGVIADRRLCKAGFPHDYKLLKGEVGVFGRTASIQAFDYVGGYMQEYAAFTLARDGVVLSVSPKPDSTWLLPAGVRLAKHPDMNVEAGIESLNGFCADEMRELLDSRRKSREDVGIIGPRTPAASAPGSR